MSTLLCVWAACMTSSLLEFQVICGDSSTVFCMLSLFVCVCVCVCACVCMCVCVCACACVCCRILLLQLSNLENRRSVVVGEWEYIVEA